MPVAILAKHNEVEFHPEVPEMDALLSGLDRCKWIPSKAKTIIGITNIPLTGTTSFGGTLPHRDTTPSTPTSSASDHAHAHITFDSAFSPGQGTIAPSALHPNGLDGSTPPILPTVLPSLPINASWCYSELLVPTRRSQSPELDEPQTHTVFHRNLVGISVARLGVEGQGEEEGDGTVYRKACKLLIRSICRTLAMADWWVC
jgi:hypothetical protein